MTADRKIQIRDALLKAGFDRVGFTGPGPFPKSEYFQEWLQHGYHGEMGYLAKDPVRRMEPVRVRDWTRSVIVAALDYNTEAPSSQEVLAEPGRGWVSRYAWGDDYHLVIEKKLKRLAGELSASTGGQFRYYVDHGPVLEKLAAVAGGLGWMGKNTLVIHPKAGSWFFLAVLLTDLTLEPEQPIRDHCGSCTRCLDVCPTNAFPTPYVLDATKCISYLTIEKGGGPAGPLAEGVGKHVFGCDLCQDVCPWNTKAPLSREEAFSPRDGFVGPDLADWASWTEDEFRERTRKSPLKRRKYVGIQENVSSATEVDEKG